MRVRQRRTEPSIRLQDSSAKMAITSGPIRRVQIKQVGCNIKIDHMCLR